jgi:hypothetical protein
LYRSVLLVGFGWALAALSILQLGVAAYIIIVVWTANKSERGFINVCGRLWKEYKKVVFLGDVISDWLHLGILVMVGFCMMEAVGHSDRFGWRSMIMYNAAVSYTYYTLFAMISSFLHQCAYYQKPHDPELTRSMAFRRLAATDSAFYHNSLGLKSPTSMAFTGSATSGDSMRLPDAKAAIEESTSSR